MIKSHVPYQLGDRAIICFFVYPESNNWRIKQYSKGGLNELSNEELRKGFLHLIYVLYIIYISMSNFNYHFSGYRNIGANPCISNVSGFLKIPKSFTVLLI